MIILLFLVFVLFIYQSNKNIPKKVNEKFSVIKIEEYEYNKQIIVKNNKYKFIIYTNIDLKIGSIVEVEGNISTFKDQRIPFGFNQRNYYISNGIYGIITDYKIIETSEYNYVYFIKEKLNTYLKQNNNNDYIRELLGYKALDDDLRNNYKAINIIHLFSLSGLNIYFILSILKKILKQFNIKKEKVELIELLVLLLLILVSNGKFVIYRVFIYYLLKYIFSIANIKITKFSLQQITFLLLILVYPFYMFNNSVLISFLLVSSISLLSPYLENDNILIKNIKLTILYTIITIPFYGFINITYLLLGSLITLFVLFGLYPIIFINLLFPNLHNITSKVIIVLEELISLSFMKQVNYNFGKMSILITLLYFILLIFIIRFNKRKICLTIIIILLFIPSITRKYQNPKLYFLDVGQGDTAVYLGNNEVIVIDSFNGTKDFLRSMGINKIDYLILSHSDFDHISEAEDIINDFEVKNIILSKNDNYNLSSKNIIKINGYLSLKTEEVQLEFFGPVRKYDKTNNNSIVFKLYFKGSSILFTGDIEKEAEEDLVLKYNDRLKSNILKSPHHGSNTSSSLDFLLNVNPTDVIISLDKDNKFGFPHNEVIDRYESLGIKIHRTDISKTILYYKKRITYPVLSL